MIELDTIPKPGIHKGVPFAEYLRWPLLSQSVLKKGTESMGHLRYAMLRETGIKPTDDMILGSALHTAFLEPEQFGDRVALWDGPRRVGAVWEQFCADNADKAILTEGMFERCKVMVEALRSHPKVAEWLHRTEAVEVSCVGEIEGVPFKGRVDALTEDPIWDLKKTGSTDDRSLATTIYTFGYHIQAYIYMRLFKRERFCLAFVEDTPYHDVRVVELSQAWLKVGEQEALELIGRYKACLRTGHWPGRSEEIDVLEPPPWLSDRHATEITIGGESAFVGS